MLGSELDHHELLALLFLSANDAEVADYGQEQADELGRSDARVEEDVPLTVLLEEHSVVGFRRVPLHDTREEDLVEGIETHSAEGQEEAVDDAKVLSTILLVAEASQSDQKTSLSEGGRGDSDDHGVGKSARRRPDHSELTKEGDQDDEDDDKRGSDFGSEEGQDAAHYEGSDDLIDSERFLDLRLLFLVLKTEDLRVLVVHAGSADHEHRYDANVPEIDSLGCVSELNIRALV